MKQTDQLQKEQQEITGLRPPLPQEKVDLPVPAKSIHNLRELAGILTRDGRVLKKGLLFRSADLHHASTEDLLLLDNLGLKRVADLRTQWEIDAAPDVLEKDWTLIHLPVLHEETMSASEHGQLQLLKLAADDPFGMVEEAYREIMISKAGISAMKKFFGLLLESDEPILWHCTQGKDRTGMAAALLLHALNVDEKLIEEEYLQTNLYVDSVIHNMNVLEDRLFAREFGTLDAAFSYAWPQYYASAAQAVLSEYGGWNGYLKNALGLSDEDLALLRERYTVPVRS